MYKTALFSGVRNIHMGIDLGAQVGTPVLSFATGKVHSFGYNPSDGDYGNVVVMEYELPGGISKQQTALKLWALYGHLASSTIEPGRLEVGKILRSGEIVGWIGKEEENGGWGPHLHFQLSVKEPLSHDMPGVVTAEDRPQALLDYPHPFHVTGRLY